MTILAKQGVSLTILLSFPTHRMILRKKPIYEKEIDDTTAQAERQRQRCKTQSLLRGENP